MRQSEPALHEPEVPESIVDEGAQVVVAVAATAPDLRKPKVRTATAALSIKAAH
jgi:hypothetical protein